MFIGCTNLTTAPELPATTLKERCYYGMFSGCTSLTTAPDLPAASLCDSCYYSMFQGCTSLNSITCLATYGITDFMSTWGWIYGVTWPTSENGIPEGWTVQDAP